MVGPHTARHLDASADGSSRYTNILSSEGMGIRQFAKTRGHVAPGLLQSAWQVSTSSIERFGVRCGIHTTGVTADEHPCLGVPSCQR